MSEIRLNAKEQAFIEQQIESGEFDDATHVVSAALQLLGNEQDDLRKLTAEADAQFANGEALKFPGAEALARSVIERGTQRLNQER